MLDMIGRKWKPFIWCRLLSGPEPSKNLTVSFPEFRNVFSRCICANGKRID